MKPKLLNKPTTLISVSRWAAQQQMPLHRARKLAHDNLITHSVYLTDDYQKQNRLQRRTVMRLTEFAQPCEQKQTPQHWVHREIYAEHWQIPWQIVRLALLNGWFNKYTPDFSFLAVNEPYPWETFRKWQVERIYLYTRCDKQTALELLPQDVGHAMLLSSGTVDGAGLDLDSASAAANITRERLRQILHFGIRQKISGETIQFPKLPALSELFYQRTAQANLEWAEKFTPSIWKP